MNHTSTSRAAIAAAGVLVLSACGNSAEDKFLAQSPRDIAKTAFEDMQAVTSVRILGTVDTDDGLTRIDLALDDNNCVGTVDSDDGGIQLIQNSDGAWFKADDEYWRSSASSPQKANELIKMYHDAWIVVAGKNLFNELCDLKELMDGFKLDKDDTEDRIDAGEVEEIGDADAIAINGREGKKRITAWVAVKEPHRVLKMAPTDGQNGLEAVYFEDFGLEVVAETPPISEIVSPPKG